MLLRNRKKGMVSMKIKAEDSKGHKDQSDQLICIIYSGLNAK